MDPDPYAGMVTPRLLIVDDDDQLRTVLGGELAEQGFDITTACDGQEAIEFMQKSMYDLVVLDIRMPRMDGFQVLRLMKENPVSPRVIMVTAFDDLNHAIESKKLGADDFIGKPYDLVELGALIERVLNN